MRSTGRRVAAVLGVLAVLAAVGGAGVWAGYTLLRSPPDVMAAPGFVLAEARTGTVGQSWRLETIAQWEMTASFPGWGSGVVTTRDFEDGAIGSPGAVLFTIGMRPVVVAQGVIPAYRDLASGMRGPDVAQLQELLRAQGFDDRDASGVFDRRVREAVRRWQRSVGVEPTGVVLQGDVVFIPDLAVPLAVADDVRPGATVAGSFDAVRTLAPTPRFTISVSGAQLAAMPEGTAVELAASSAPWQAVVSSTLPPDDVWGSRVLLTAPDGGPVCGQACAEVPVAAPSSFPSLVRMVPEQTGVVVPTAAVFTRADGTAGVTLESGEFRPVTVLASASGSAVVTGIDAGTRVRTPGAG